MERVRTWLRWATGWTLISLFYAHSLFATDTAAVTPAASVILAALMTVTALMGLGALAVDRPPTTFRRGAMFTLVFAISLWVLVSISHYLITPPTSRDLGQFGIYCLIPILLLLNRERAQLVTFVARLCVIMTLADLAYNLLAIVGVVTPLASGGAIFLSGVRVDRHPGISGSILSAGEVALIGVLYSAWRTRCKPRKIPKAGWYLIFGLCALGLHIVIARRYEVAAIVGAAIILIPWARRVPLPIYALIQAGFGLYFTFTSLDPEEVLRSRLISAAADDVGAMFWFGRGIYTFPPAASQAFSDMRVAGVTESGALDLALAFGAPAAALFFVAVALALFAKRASVTWMPVLVTVFAGTFAYNNPLGFLGSVVFFGALLSAILEEAPDGRGYFNVRNPIHGAAMARG